MSNGKAQREILETALLAGQIMCESNAEAYRVEDTMNRILTLSKAAYAVAISSSTSIYAILADPSYEDGNYIGLRRITQRDNNLNKISEVNSVSRQLVAGDLEVEEALEQLIKIRPSASQYNKWWHSFGIILLSICFTILFGGGAQEAVAGAIDGTILALATLVIEKYFLNNAWQNALKAMIVTIVSYLVYMFMFHSMDPNIVITATLMPIVPGTAITNALRDIFREDYIAGGARILEAFSCALMIAIGSVVGLAIIEGVF